MTEKCLTNLVAFDGVTELTDKGRAADTCLDSCKVFDPVLHNIVNPKLEEHGFDGCGWSDQRCPCPRSVELCDF